ncbi:MAG TPA: Ig-like domain-containing protein [Solirubrobacteraceae bacterium]
MIHHLTTTAKSAGLKLPLALLGVLAVAFGIHVATSAGAPKVATPTITSKPATPTSETSATFAFSSGSGVTYECSRDGAAFSACASPKSYSGLAVGSHTFQVRARRPSGDLSSAASYTWVIDRTPPPAPAITDKPASLTDEARARFAFTDAESGVAFLCRLDGGAFSNCPSPESYSRLADGSHTFQVQARDAAGNTSGATSYTWRIDTLPPPAPTLTGYPSQPTTSTTATFTFTDTEAGVGYECRLDDDWSACTSPRTYTGLDSGRHTFGVRALDAAGNRSRATSFTWTITRATNRDFTISGSASALLYPGAPAQPIALTLTNPNSVAIYVTSLQVTVAGSSSPGCSPATNLGLTQSNASSAAPARVPAGGSVTLPAQGVSAPTIRLLNLPVNQDACKNATFSLSYSGSAHS